MGPRALQEDVAARGMSCQTRLGAKHPERALPVSRSQLGGMNPGNEGAPPCFGEHWAHLPETNSYSPKLTRRAGISGRLSCVPVRPRVQGALPASAEGIDSLSLGLPPRPVFKCCILRWRHNGYPTGCTLQDSRSPNR